MFSCEICKIFKNTYFEEHLLSAASALLLKLNSNYFLQRVTVSEIMYHISGFLGKPSQNYANAYLETRLLPLFDNPHIATVALLKPSRPVFLPYRAETERWC